MSGIANATHPPTLGPHIDADPGTPDGENMHIFPLLLAFENLHTTPDTLCNWDTLGSTLCVLHD